MIVNAGDGEAGLFPIVITADGEPVPFDVPGEDPSALVTRTPLGPGERVSYTGTVWLPLETRLDAVGSRREGRRPARGIPALRRNAKSSNQRKGNNSLPLQGVGLQVTNLEVGQPEEPPGFFAARQLGGSTSLSCSTCETPARSQPTSSGSPLFSARSKVACR